MYQSQVKELKEQILKSPIFDCKLTGDSNGIKIIGVVKLSNQINQNNHHVYIDLDNFRGIKYFAVTNLAEMTYSFDKPDNEVGCSIDIYNDNVSVRILGKDGKYSQLVEGLSAHHTIYGHSSYYILATLESEVTQPTEPISHLKQELINLRQRLTEIIEEIG